MSYELFRHLCNVLEIRTNSKADRDRSVYQKLCKNLKMGSVSPKQFFQKNPEVSEQEVLIAFLKTFEPFSIMLEDIFIICSNTQSGATGGNDFTIKYNENEDSLQFNLEAYKRWKRIKYQSRSQLYIPKFHPDYIPVYSYFWNRILERTGRVSSDMKSSSITQEKIVKTFDQALEIGQSHLAAFEVLYSDLQEAENLTSEKIESWYEDTGINGICLPTTVGGVEFWKECIDDGIRRLQTLSPKFLINKVNTNDISEFNWILNQIADLVIQEFTMDRMEAWLELPYWKKRWQLYEIWIASKCIDYFLRRKGKLILDSRNQLVLRTMDSKIPLCEIEYNISNKLELWMEFPLQISNIKTLRLDIAFVYKHRDSRMPVSFIECKQRVNVSEEFMFNDALKYLPSMPLWSESILVNYDDFSTSLKVRKKIICENNRKLIAIDQVRPAGGGVDKLEKHIMEAIGFVTTNWFILIDTTASMHSQLPFVTEHLIKLRMFSQYEIHYSLVLIGDHDTRYTVQFQKESTSIDEIVESFRHAPLTIGSDKPEALEDAIHFVNQIIRDQGVIVNRVTMFSDAEPHLPEECPNKLDFYEEIKKLQSTGCDIELVSCGVRINKLSWQNIKNIHAIELKDHIWIY